MKTFNERFNDFNENYSKNYPNLHPELLKLKINLWEELYFYGTDLEHSDIIEQTAGKRDQINISTN